MHRLPSAAEIIENLRPLGGNLTESYSNLTAAGRNNKFLRLCDFVIDYVGFPTRQRGSNPQPKLHTKSHQRPSKRHARGREIFQNLIQNLTKADNRQIAADERFCERFSEISHALAWLQPAAETSHQKPSKVIKKI